MRWTRDWSNQQPLEIDGRSCSDRAGRLGCLGLCGWVVGLRPAVRWLAGVCGQVVGCSPYPPRFPWQTSPLSLTSLPPQVREAQLSQYNYILVVGEKEQEERTVNVSGITVVTK